MKFIDPSFKELYDTLRNNNRLEKFFISNSVLNVIDDYYENYGYNNEVFNAETIINEANSIVYKQLTEVLLNNIDYIKSQSLRELVAKRFLATDIKEALNFTDDIEIADDILWEIFYCIKYCYTSSFFQNNWELFVPEYDFSEMQKNNSIVGFMDSIMKEFDKLDNIMNDVRKFKSYSEIPYKYIVYLTQLMGIEPKDFMIMENQKELYRVMAENIMDIYSIRGTPDCFELLFNFLGYNIKIEEYFFDRRRYFSLSESNEELTTSDINSFKFYLTTKDPRNNILDELSTGEIVTPDKMSEILNIRDFDELVEKYGLMCVLGYNDEYIAENKIENVVRSTDIKKYTGPVYKYFRTNYVRVKPTSKYTSGNFSLNQLYQLSALLNFLIPEFLQRETYVIIDIGETEEEMILNWTKDYTNDSFYMLDSEGWNQNFSNKFLINYSDFVNSGYSIEPTTKDDLGRIKNYTNSIGKSIHYANSKYSNVFFNPISEKIKIINSTKYWGDKVKTSQVNSAAYPIYRINENYSINNSVYTNPDYKIKNSQIKELYLPKDLEYSSGWEKKQWEDMETVGLNGFNGSSLKNKIRDMVYKNNSYFDYASKSNGVINIDYVVDDIEDFLDTSTDESSWNEQKKIFFKKEWKRVDNYTWKAKFQFGVDETDFIDGFAAKHKNIINYDYINKKLFSFNDFYNLSFNIEGDYEIINYSRGEYNNEALNIINRIIKPGNYFIVLNRVTNRYTVYQYEIINNFKGLYLNRYYPIPIAKQNSDNLYIFKTYKELQDSISDTIFTYNNKTIDLSKDKNINFYITEDKSYYKPMLETTYNRRIIHTNLLEKITTSTINLIDVNSEDKISKGKIGSVYFIPMSDEDVEEEQKNYFSLKEIRENKIMQYKYSNIKSGLLIYSKKNEKLYKVINNGVYYTKNTLMVTGRVSYGNERGEKWDKGSFFGIEEINFYGRFILENDKAKIYEYDDCYYGFSEQDDDDNFVLNNYDRIYDWERMKIYSYDEYGRRDEVKRKKFEDDKSYKMISNKRPIKVNIDKIFEEKDVDNIISSDILQEICESYGSNYVGKDNVSMLG